MRVLITAGGTYENIDSVRSITNKATGRLGAIIADTFAKENWQVTYLCSETAAQPTCEELRILRVSNVAELMETMETLLNTHRYDSVIHSMAVSDFTPRAVTSVDEMAKAIATAVQANIIPNAEMQSRIRDIILNCQSPLTDKKISSGVSDMVLLLTNTPKVIGHIKRIQPNTVLVGFKLLSNVKEEELLQAAYNLLEQNGCDFVIANDLSSIKNDNHRAMLVDNNRTVCPAHTKQDIAKMIFKCVSERITNA